MARLYEYNSSYCQETIKLGEESFYVNEMVMHFNCRCQTFYNCARLSFQNLQKLFQWLKNIPRLKNIEVLSMTKNRRLIRTPFRRK